MNKHLSILLLLFLLICRTNLIAQTVFEEITDTCKLRTTITTEVIVNNGDTCIKITETTPIDSVPQIFRKVFPQVDFYLKSFSNSSIVVTGSKDLSLFFNFDSKIYYPIWTFNFLLSKMKYDEPLSLDDKILAFITLTEYLQTNDLFNKIIIKDKSSCEFKVNNNLPAFNYLLTVNVNGIDKKMYVQAIHDGIYMLANEYNNSYPINDRRRYKVYAFESWPLPLRID